DKDPKKVADQQPVDQAGQQLSADLTMTAQELSHQRDAPQELWGALLNIGQGLRPKLQASAEARRLYLRHHRLQDAEAAYGRRFTQAMATEIAELEKDVLYLE